LIEGVFVYNKMAENMDYNGILVIKKAKYTLKKIISWFLNSLSGKRIGQVGILTINKREVHNGFNSEICQNIK